MPRRRVAQRDTSVPVLEFPGLEFPRREVFQPPLDPAIRRPVAQAGFFLGFGRRDHARHDAAPALPRRLADHVDEFGLVGHGGCPRAMRMPPQCAPDSLTTPFAAASMLKRRGPLQCQSLISTKCPAIAAAAAIAGETRWVRPLNPCRPSKLRFEVEAQRSSGASLSGFIARHIEQPGSRHSKPALVKILSSPSASACSFTIPEPGTTIALTLSLTVLPSAILAAARRSSMRPLVQEPMKMRSSLMSVTFVPAIRPIYFRARCL